MGPNIILLTLTFIVIEFFTFRLLYEDVWTLTVISEKILNCVVIFIYCTMLGMIVTYVAQIRGKMSTLMIENLNLLNKMHEGLIVIAEEDRSI